MDSDTHSGGKQVESSREPTLSHDKRRLVRKTISELIRSKTLQKKHETTQQVDTRRTLSDHIQTKQTRLLSTHRIISLNVLAAAIDKVPNEPNAQSDREFSMISRVVSHTA